MQKLNVIKIGGNVIDDEMALQKFLSDISQINSPFVLIHGGGKLATKLAEKLGISQEIINGRRITNAETLKIATMVYAGYVNKNIVAGLQKLKLNAIGLSGADANIIKSKKRKNNPIDYGYVGDLDIQNIEVDFLKNILSQSITPVICAITHDGQGQLLNTNADTIANFIAIALSKFYDIELVYCMEKVGVLKDPNDDNSLIYELEKISYEHFKSLGIISDGMIPKLDNCFDALNQGVKEVSIIHAKNILPFINQLSNEGTRIRQSL